MHGRDTMVAERTEQTTTTETDVDSEEDEDR
jgi:hypothetical protein